MPATSKKQFRFMAAIEHGGIPGKGSLTPSKAAEFVDSSNYKSLPETHRLAAPKKLKPFGPRLAAKGGF